jgi:simple sugar transport system ATP-binding protein
MICMRGIEKRFGPVRANRGAALEVMLGEIHALVGENGAGKSTLMRILAGLFAPDAGEVEVNGQDVTGWSAADAIGAGVGMVHQHFMLVPTLTVAENVVLGREPRRGIAVDMARATLEVEELGRRFGLEVESRRFVKDLSVGEAQRVEILKTLFRGARILILDEPTAVLSPPEVRELWRVLRRLRDGGGTIILITHKLDEVIEISDRITVMRHGETVARMTTSETTPAEIARAMVGREVALVGSFVGSDVGSDVAAGSPPRPHDREPEAAERHPSVADDIESSRRGGPPPPREGSTTAPAAAHRSTAAGIDSPLAAALEVQHLVVSAPGRPRAVDGVTFSISPGEILGIAGVEGNGQTELVEAIAGLRPAASGNILIGPRDLTRLTVRDRGDAGLAHIPEDRHRRGLVLEYSVADNLILGAQHHYARRGQLDRSRIAGDAERRIAEFDIRPADRELPARALSGGNQQKVVIAREMGREYAVLLASQPTRGVDVGAIEFIHGQLRAARAAGKAVLLVSAELTEILALADRVAVMYRGRIVAILPRAEASEEALGPLMTGVAAGGASAA